jgi:hypothetical protein
MEVERLLTSSPTWQAPKKNVIHPLSLTNCRFGV